MRPETLPVLLGTQSPEVMKAFGVDRAAGGTFGRWARRRRD